MYPGDKNHNIFRQYNVKHQNNKNRRDYDNSKRFNSKFTIQQLKYVMFSKRGN